MNKTPKTVVSNDRVYAWPKDPTIIVCIDGSEPGYAACDQGGYIERAVAAGVMPHVERMRRAGTSRLADSVVPSFTNPNNVSIVTGVPPAVHGICGNFFLDPDAGEEVMMNDPKFLRAGTILADFERAGAGVAVVTAKDKLLRLLADGLSFGAGGSIGFSAEKADQATLEANGIKDVLNRVELPLPDVYSADLTEFVFAAGLELLAEARPDLLYLSTTDYIQHKHAPGSPEANAFYRMMDSYLGRLDAMGAILVITADHGMKAKHDGSGAPRVVYLQSLLDDWLGATAARVICPITDPYVVHHGALGGFVTAYLPAGTDIGGLLNRLGGVDGIDTALTRAEACRRFGLPGDRVGDIIVMSSADTVIGSSPDRHDLSGLGEPLRSHGGLSEQTVPIIANRPTPTLSAHRRLRNFDAFDIALNHAQPAR